MPDSLHRDEDPAPLDGEHYLEPVDAAPAFAGLVADRLVEDAHGRLWRVRRRMPADVALWCAIALVALAIVIAGWMLVA